MEGIDSPKSIREAMIARRGKAFAENNAEDIVLFSHVIVLLQELILLGDTYRKGNEQ